MQVISASVVRSLDEQAKAMGIDGILLMDHAAIRLKEHLDVRLSKDGIQRVKIVCGSGNNGGDGFALARLLHNDRRYDVEIICAYPLTDIHGDAQTFARIVQSLHIPWYDGQDVKAILERLSHCDSIVDCLFGTGLNRIIDGWNAQLIDLINAQDVYVVAADIPSGIDADRGIVLGTAIKATTTITFAAGKLGLYVNEGRAHSGHVEIVSIALPAQLFETSDSIPLLDDALVKKMLPKRDPHGHKGSFGKGLLIGGQVGMSGAVVMAAQSAQRIGIGTMSVMVPDPALPIVASQCAEMMCLAIPMKQNLLDKEALKKQLQAYDVIAFGNGMGRSALTEEILKVVWESDRPCIFDGDALYYLHAFKEKRRSIATALTPHPKEVSYLLGINTNDCMKNPAETLKMLKKGYPDCAIAMKDANTLVFDAEQCYLNVHGNDGLATGGSGDVLCGMILGLLAQKVRTIHAVSVGVYLHARCAEYLAMRMSTCSILPRDIIEQLPKTIFDLKK